MSPLDQTEQDFVAYWTRLLTPVVAKHVRVLGADERIRELRSFLHLRLIEGTPSIMRETGALCVDRHSPQRNYILQLLHRAAVEFMQQQQVPFQVSRNDARVLSKAAKAGETLAFQLGREPTLEEVAEAINIKSAKLAEMQIIAPPAPLEDVNDTPHHHDFGDLRASTVQVLDALDTPVARAFKRHLFDDAPLMEACEQEGVPSAYRALEIDSLRRHLARSVCHHRYANTPAHKNSTSLDRRVVRQDYKRKAVKQIVLAMKYGCHRTTISRVLANKPKGKPGAPRHPATELVMEIRQQYDAGPYYIMAFLRRHHPEVSISFRTISRILYER